MAMVITIITVVLFLVWMIQATAQDFHLQSGSPAIDAGICLSEVLEDFDGVSRPQAIGCDIGAYEFDFGSPPPLPPPPSLNPPGNLMANALGAEAIELTWSDNSADEMGFILERSTKDAGLYTIALGPDRTGHLDTELTKNTRYCYRAAAIRDALTSVYSNEACERTKAR